MNKLQAFDYAVFLFYFVVVAAYGVWIYKRKQRQEASTTDFFLAEGALTWWAIGASLIASNISAEQFIGMSGDGFRVGVAVAAYEWLAAISLIIVAVFFMPIYLKNRIFTMPQFLKERYNESVAMIMAVFWLFLYVCVNLTAILYLGASAIHNILGKFVISTPFMDIAGNQVVMLLLALFATIITIGGMKVIGYTDVIQVVVLIIGGLATTYIALQLVGEHFKPGSGAIAGFKFMMQDANDHFHLMFWKPDANSPPDYIPKYLALPAVMYLGGQWIANMSYWGCNQYITQRALGADLKTARTGILFAALLKIFMPVIVMLPGIAAYVLHKNGQLPTELVAGGKVDADLAYSAVLGYLPMGLRGLSLAALTAAIVASLAGKANSISTIFTLDIYKKYVDREANEKKLVWIGRVVIVLAMIAALCLTWEDALGIKAGGFKFIQKYTGYVSPGIFAIFLLGMFWKRTTGAAALLGILGGFALSVFFNDFAPNLGYSETPLYTVYQYVGGDGKIVHEIPFLICMAWTFVFTVLLMVVVSLAFPEENPRSVVIDRSMFKLAPSTTMLCVVVMLLLGAIYAKFW